MPALANEVVSSTVIPPSVGWSLSAFSWEYGLVKFAALCIENEPDVIRRKHILDMATRDLRIDNASDTDWQQLKDVAKKFALKNSELEHVLAFHSEQIKASTDTPTNHMSQMAYPNKSKNTDWEKIIGNLDLITPEGISNAIDRFNALPFPREPEVFWTEVLKRVSVGNASNFLQAIAVAESAHRLDVQSALSCFPDTWRN